ncbi:MAG: hypothetical protein RR812_05770 [Vagococcus sp.]
MKNTNTYNNKYEITYLREADEEVEPQKDQPEADKSSTLKDKLVKIISNAAKNYAKDKTGKIIDTLLLGNLKDALFDIFKSKKASGLSNDELKTALDTLQQSKEYQKAAEYQALDSRKDDVPTSTEIDDASRQFYTLWYGSKEDGNLVKIISGIVTEIQQQTTEVNKAITQLKSDIKRLKLDKDVSEEDINNYGPVLIQLIADKKSNDEIKTELKKLKSNVKESYSKKLNVCKNYKFILEGKRNLSSTKRQELLIESLYGNREYLRCVEKIVSEGFLSNSFSAIKNKMKGFKDKIKDVGSKGLEAITKGAVGPILKLGGLGVSLLVNGFGPTLILKTMDIIEQHGKKLRNCFERQYSKFVNSKGVIAEMNFSLKDDPKKKYSARFYITDMVWRVVNVTDQLKHPSKEFTKEILTSEFGKKYLARLKAIWDPLFAKDKGGSIDFEELFKQAKSLNLSEKQLTLFKDFSSQYDNVVASCITSPKIDTRNAK